MNHVADTVRAMGTAQLADVDAALKGRVTNRGGPSHAVGIRVEDDTDIRAIAKVMVLVKNQG
jgi:hypothetical protein